MDADPSRDKQASKMTNLEIELVPTIPRKTYQNVGHLTLIVVSLCLASFYFGFCLTFISNVSSDTMVLYFGS